MALFLQVLELVYTRKPKYLHETAKANTYTSSSYHYKHTRTYIPSSVSYVNIYFECYHILKQEGIYEDMVDRETMM